MVDVDPFKPITLAELMASIFDLVSFGGEHASPLDFERIIQNDANSAIVVVKRPQGLATKFTVTVEHFAAGSTSNAYDMVRALGATISSGINWDWALDFPTRKAAETFVEWLEINNFEHRGIYQDTGEETSSVRFRKA